MKKLLALVSLLTVGLLVGCGGEKPKVVIDPAAKMKEMQDKNNAMIDVAKKAADETGATVEGAVDGAAKDAIEKIEGAAEGAEKVIKVEAEKGKEEVKEEAEKVKEEVKEAAKDGAEKVDEAVKEAAGDK